MSARIANVTGFNGVSLANNSNTWLDVQVGIQNATVADQHRSRRSPGHQPAVDTGNVSLQT